MKDKIEVLKFFTSQSAYLEEFGDVFFETLDEVLIFFEKEMKKRTIETIELTALWLIIAELNIDSYNNMTSNKKTINNMKKILSETTNTDGFMDVFNFLNNDTLNSNNFMKSLCLGKLKYYFHFVKNKKDHIYFYKTLFDTIYVKLDFNKMSLYGTLFYSEEIDFLISNFNEIMPNDKKNNHLVILEDNILELLENSSKNENDEKVRYFKDLLRNTKDDFIKLDKYYFSNFITKYINSPYNDHLMKELVRVVNIKETKKNLSDSDLLDISKKSRNRIRAIENILNVKLDFTFLKEQLLITDFDYESICWILKHNQNKFLNHYDYYGAENAYAQNDNKENSIINLIRKESLFEKKENYYTLTIEHKNIIEINLKN